VGRVAIESHPRVGVDYAGEWAKKLWRFRLRRVPSPIRARRTKKQGGAG
jgi:hypothetical protein